MSQTRIISPSLESDAPGFQSQRDQAYHRIRRLLILQQISEGERLREAQWATKLQVNRAALREAFARLEAEGLIEKGSKTGYFLPVLTGASIQEIVEVRNMLEGGAIERIIRQGHNTPQHLRSMRDACDQLERLVREEYHLGVAEADRHFHEALIDAAQNRRLSSLYARAPLPIIHPIVVTGKEWAERVRRTLEEHRAILDAILAGDAEGARALLRTHLNDRHCIPFCER
jgi:DNA-binding GntR family transcriptional regulator